MSLAVVSNGSLLTCKEPSMKAFLIKLLSDRGIKFEELDSMHFFVPNTKPGDEQLQALIDAELDRFYSSVVYVRDDLQASKKGRKF
eukprot:m51a1_g2490 hypothetical protein (86) ;mRNA; f:90639-90953